MSTISSVQSYGAASFRPQAQPEGEIQAAPTLRGREDQSFAPDDKDARRAEDRGQTAPPTPRLDASSVSSRLDDLIAGQVSSGTLTSDQAADLRTVFAADAPMGGADLSQTSRSIDGLPQRSGPVPGPTAGPEGGRAGQTRDTAETDRQTALDQFVQQLRQSVASSYSSRGGATRAAPPLVFDGSA